MANNYKHLYEQMKTMVEMYQDELVPGLRKKIEELERERVEVVRCQDCKHSSPKHHFDLFRWVYCRKWGTEIKKNDFCSYGKGARAND